MTNPDFEAGYAAGQRDMRNRARQVVIASAQSGGATFSEVARAIGALPVAGEIPRMTAMPPAEMERIIAEISVELGLPRREIAGPGKAHGPTMARWLAAQLGRDLLGLSTTELGRALGRDHSTIIHALRTIEHRLERSPDLREAKERIIKRLGAANRQQGQASP